MKLLKLAYRLFLVLKSQYGFNIVAIVYRMAGFFVDYGRYASLHANDTYRLSVLDWYPCLTDRTTHTPLDPVYFYQDTWAARKIFENLPAHHYDVGSSAKTIGIISQFVPTTMIDIRPVELPLDNLFFKQGSILELPFENESIESISSICVIEHIGLGRYGDPLDQFGSEKAASELQRVTKKGGHMYISVPVDDENITFFNAHRSFSRERVIGLFDASALTEERYISDTHLLHTYKPSRGYTVGLFMFTKL